MRDKIAKIYGTDLNGRRCITALVAVPLHYDHEQTVRHVRGINRPRENGYFHFPYAAVAAEDVEVAAPSTSRCQCCGQPLPQP
jgi:hypothetical protein